MKLQLMTDSGADLTKALQEKWDVNIISLFVLFGSEQFKSESLTTHDFLARITNTKTFPSSSAPSPQDYYDAFVATPADTPIVLVSVSSGVSASYNHALMGKTMLLEKEPNRIIHIVDSKAASSGMMLLLELAHELKEKDTPLEKIVETLNNRVPYLRTIFVLETLDNLIRGGRLDKVKGTVAKTLNVKLILHASHEGKIEVLEKVRGTKKATRRFVETIGEYIQDTKDKTFGLTHGNDPSRCEQFLSLIKERYQFKKIITAETGPVISAHAGQGAIVMSFFSDKAR